MSPDPVTVTTADDGWYRAVTDFAHHSAWLHGAMSFFTSAAIGLLALMTASAWISARRHSNTEALAAATWTCFGSLIAVALGMGLKQVFQETRPCSALHVVAVQACPGPTDYSFPSDHTTLAAAIAVGLWLTNRALGAVAIAVAILEGFSRVYLGLHYPHDVAAGFSLSAVVLIGGWPLARRPLTHLLRVRDVRSAHDGAVGSVQGVGHR